MIIGSYTIIDPSEDRYLITAFTIKLGRNKLIGTIYLRPMILKYTETIKAHFNYVKYYLNSTKPL